VGLRSVGKIVRRRQNSLSAVFVQTNGFGMLIADPDGIADGHLKLAHAAMHAAVQLLLGQQSEPALDQIDPGGTDGRELQVVARTFGQPAADQGRLVGRPVV